MPEMDLPVNPKDRILDAEAPLRNLVLAGCHKTILDPVLVFTDLLHFRCFENEARIRAAFYLVKASRFRSQVKLESLAPDLLLTLLEVDVTLPFNVLRQSVPLNFIGLEQHVLIVHFHFASSAEFILANALLFD